MLCVNFEYLLTFHANHIPIYPIWSFLVVEIIHIWQSTSKWHIKQQLIKSRSTYYATLRSGAVARGYAFATAYGSLNLQSSLNANKHVCGERGRVGGQSHRSRHACRAPAAFKTLYTHALPDSADLGDTEVH